ncbi:hypothetical protein LZ31DRAFT_107710 [Colletotrichum somersetense]|nr:hypothetical protein LZ31DRAFT_107710 [Colletotrichum somersetense]
MRVWNTHYPLGWRGIRKREIIWTGGEGGGVRPPRGGRVRGNAVSAKRRKESGDGDGLGGFAFQSRPTTYGVQYRTELLSSTSTPGGGEGTANWMDDVLQNAWRARDGFSVDGSWLESGRNDFSAVGFLMVAGISADVTTVRIHSTLLLARSASVVGSRIPDFSSGQPRDSGPTHACMQCVPSNAMRVAPIGEPFLPSWLAYLSTESPRSRWWPTLRPHLPRLLRVTHLGAPSNGVPSSSS